MDPAQGPLFKTQGYLDALNELRAANRLPPLEAEDTSIYREALETFDSSADPSTMPEDWLYHGDLAQTPESGIIESPDALEEDGSGAGDTGDLERKTPEGAEDVYKSTPELENHIQHVDLSVPRSRGIGGAHNSEEFLKNDVKLVKSIQSKEIPGVTYYQYNMPLLGKDGKPVGGYGTTIFEKTVYDPSIFSDNEYLSRGLEAANDSYRRNGILEEYWEGYDSQGIKWVGFVENGVPKSFYPYVPKQ